MTIRNERAEIRWTVADIILASAISIGAFVIFLAVVGGVASIFRWERELAWLAWLGALAESVLLIAVWLIAIKKYRLPWTVLGLRLPARRTSFLLAALALLGSLTFTAFYALTTTSLGFETLVPEQLPAELAGDGAYILVTALALGVWVPFVEEVFFRGFLFAGLSARYGLLVGVVVSAALFALVHFSLATIIPIFVTGVLFALVYHATRSIWIPIAAHAAQNLLALLSSRFIAPEPSIRAATELGMI